MLNDTFRSNNRVEEIEDKEKENLKLMFIITLKSILYL